MSFDPVPSNTHHNLDEQIVQLRQCKPLSEQEGFVSTFGARGESTYTMNDQSQMMNQHQMMMNPPQMMNPMVVQPNMMSQSYGNWPQQLPKIPNMPNMGSLKFPNQMNQMYGAPEPGRSNWKGKKKAIDNKRKDGRRKDMILTGPGAGTSSGAAIGSGYKPPTLNELEHQNRLKARRFYPKKKFNRMGPYAHAPRNTTSYLIRAKKEGGIASLVSPCPVTPAVLPTPVFSPSREALVDMAKEEWGVDGYGSMKGLIRLRCSSPGHEADMDDYEDEDDGGGSSESDVEEHLEVERRLDHDLSRFEMIYPNYGTEYNNNNVLENRVDDQDAHIAQLEEENLSLKERLYFFFWSNKERLYLMEREFGEIKRRMQFLERQNQVVEDINEEVVENISEYASEGTNDAHILEEKNNTLNSQGNEHGREKEGNVGEPPNSQQATSLVKEPCQDGSLLNQVDLVDGRKEIRIHNEKDDLEMVKDKNENHDMAVEYCNVQKFDSKSLVDSDVNFGVSESDVGKKVVENDNATEDNCIEDSAPSRAHEDVPSVQ